MAQLKTAQAKPKEAEPRHVHAIRIEIGKDGGHVVRHEMRGGSPEVFGGGEEGPHIFGAEDGEKLLAHLKKHANISSTKPEEEDERESPEKANKKHKEREKASDEESMDDDSDKED